MYDRPRPLSSNISSEGSLPVIGENSFSDDTPVGLPDTSFEFGQCALRGYLYKKEKFMTWVKHFCIIRNNFLECHKINQFEGSAYCPALKLFLPRSKIIRGGGDAKRKWAFQVGQFSARLQGNNIVCSLLSAQVRACSTHSESL